MNISDISDIPDVGSDACDFLDCADGNAGISDEREGELREYREEIKNLKISLALRNALGDCHDFDIAEKFIEKDKILVNGDEISGLNEQVKALRKAKPFLFVQKAGGIRPASPASSDSVTGEKDYFLQGFKRKY